MLNCLSFRGGDTTRKNLLSQLFSLTLNSILVIYKSKVCLRMALKCIRSSIPVLNSISSSRFIEFYDYTAENINKNPTVLFVPGFNSSGHGLKSQAFIKHCQSKNLRYVCYDPEGLGESKIEDMANLKFQHWFEDAETAIKQCQSDKIVLVGSSMGGWISLKMANENPDKIQGWLPLRI